MLDHQPVLEGIARSLRPGGRCVLQMGGKRNGTEVIRPLDRCLRDARWQGSPPAEIPYEFHPPGDYLAWLETAGLTPDSVDLIEKDMVHSDLASFTGWLRTAWLPYTARVPANLRDQFLEAVTESYAATNPPDAAGQVQVGMVRPQVLAHKAH